MSPETLESLSQASVTWICCCCGLPNFHPDIFNEQIPTSKNRFVIFEEPNKKAPVFRPEIIIKLPHLKPKPQHPITKCHTFTNPTPPCSPKPDLPIPTPCNNPKPPSHIPLMKTPKQTNFGLPSPTNNISLPPLSLNQVPAPALVRAIDPNSKSSRVMKSPASS